MKPANSFTGSRSTSLVEAGTALLLLLTATVHPAWAAKPPKPPPPPPSSPAPYTYVNLGSLDGGYGNVHAINNAGLVVGSSVTGTGLEHAFIVVPQDTNNDTQPDLWNPTGTPQGPNPLMIDLGLPAGVPEPSLTYAMDVNDLGQVVGYCYQENYSTALGPWVIEPADTDGDGQLEWCKADGNGVNALMVPLRLTGSYNDWIAINNLGQIVAACADGGCLLTPVDTNGDGRPDTWWRDADADGSNDLLVRLGQAFDSRGTLVDLQPRDINDLGQIVGSIPAGPNGGRTTPFLLAPHQVGSGVVWFNDANHDGENDLVVRLPLPVDAVGGGATAINSQGSIAGDYRNSRGFLRALLWRTGTQGDYQYTDLGVPKNEEYIGVHGINDRDQVVGLAHTYGAKAVYLKATGWVWENGIMTDVRTLMDKASELSGLKMETMGINSAGLMTGWTSSSETTSPRWPWIAVPIP